MTCLITGCALVTPLNDYAWGDLHRIGATWVFNPTLDNGETNWQRNVDLKAYADECQLIIFEHMPAAGYFERRGVIVIEHDWAQLNDVALAYLGGRL